MQRLNALFDSLLVVAANGAGAVLMAHVPGALGRIGVISFSLLVLAALGLAVIKAKECR